MAKYLTVDEQATYIDVTCDGYVFRLYSNEAAADILQILDADGTTSIVLGRFALYVGGTYYTLRSDGERTTTLIEDTPIRTVIRVMGNYEDEGGETELANSTSLELYFYIYADRYYVSGTWITSANITIGALGTYTYQSNLTVAAAITGEGGIYESSGTETSGTWAAVNSADYFGKTSDQLNFIVSTLAASDSEDWGQYLNGDTDLLWGWAGATINAGTHTFCIGVSLDADNRENAIGITGSQGNTTATSSGSYGDDFFNYTTFIPSVTGYVNTFTFHTQYSSAENHVAGIYDSGGTLIGSTNEVDAPDNGEQDIIFTFDTPVLLTASTTYYIGVSSDTGQYCAHFYEADSGIDFQYVAHTYASDVPASITPGSDPTALSDYALRMSLSWVPQFLDWDTTLDGTSVAVGTICEQSADGLRYICHTAHTAGAGNEPPDTDYWHEYRMTLGDQYKDLVMAAPATGSEVTDLVIPMDLSSDGFAADGARHMEMDTEVLEYTNDIARIGHVDVIHDPMITTDGTTERRIEVIQANDNAASATVIAAIGDNANWETSEGVDRNTSNDTVSTGIARGTGLDTGGTYHIEHDVTAYDNAYFKAGTKIITLTPQFAYNVATDQAIWSLYVDPGDYLYIGYDATNDCYEFRLAWGGNSSTLTGPAYTSDIALQLLTTITACWDSDQDRLQFSINGQVVDNDTNTGTPSGSGAAYVMTGADCITDADGTAQLEADIIIDRQIATAGMQVLGAYFTGNGEVDTDLAHEDIGFYWSGVDCTSSNIEIGGIQGTQAGIGTFETSGSQFNGNYYDNASSGGDMSFSLTSSHIDFEEGVVSFWLRLPSLVDNDYLFGIGDGDDSLQAYVEDSGGSDFRVVFRYEDNTSVEAVQSDFSLSVDTWTHVACYYSYSKALIWMKINDVLQSDTEAINNPWNGGTTGTLYIGASLSGGAGIDAHFSDFYITKDSHTPQIPVVLGAGPIYAPIKDVS